MDDDFLSDISSAVENGGELPVTTVVEQVANGQEQQTPVQQQQPVQEGNDAKAVEDRLNDIMDGPKKPERKTLTVPAAKQEKPADQQQQQPNGQQPQQKQERTIPYLDVFLLEDKDKNLVLEDGTIIAPAGKGRLYYEMAKKEGREARAAANQQALANVQLGKKFQELHNQFLEFKNNPSTKSFEEQTGMDAAEITSLVAIAKAYKQNPLEGIKMLLTEASANGIDVSSLGVNTAVDPATLQRMVKNAISAAIPQQTQSQNSAPTEEQVREEATAFFNDNPDAREYVSVLANAKQKAPHLSLDELWVRFKIHQQTLLEQEQAQLGQEAQKRFGQPQTQQQRQVPQGRPVTRVVTPPPRDYSRMSFAEIANSITQDYTR